MAPEAGNVPWDDADLSAIVERLRRIRASLIQMESAVDLSQFGDRKPSARNLLHYLALRHFDIHDIQERLSLMGISSLGRAEGHVLYNLDAVLAILGRVCNINQPPEVVQNNSYVTPSRGRELLEKNTEALFGPKGRERGVRIMVTMPTEAATDYALVRDLVASGMDCMRINCAHDAQPEWLRMIENLRRAEKETSKKCRILMDLAGPKLRTGRLKPGPRVVKWRPLRNVFGLVAAPARVWLTPSEKPESPPSTAQASLPLPAKWLDELEPEDIIRFRDTRGARRRLLVSGKVGSSRWAECRNTCYVKTGTRMAFRRPSPTSGPWKWVEAKVGNLPRVELPIILRREDIILLSRRSLIGRSAERKGDELKPAIISTTLPKALSKIVQGQRVWFDDGKIGGLVKSVSASGVEVEISHAADGGSKLFSDKGINLPDTDVSVPSLTKKDLEDLDFIVKHADIVGYSFVNRVEDLRILHNRLRKLGRADMATVLKIETLKAFEELPSLLLASMCGPAAGVMIARGDLAVEAGYERLAEIQEEILWLCEAAHLPAIWATQVLESLTKNGLPSRAEVTDAAMADRAECVMLNKGPFVVPAVQALDNILRRMQVHQMKKSPMLIHLGIADTFFKEKGISLDG